MLNTKNFGLKLTTESTSSSSKTKKSSTIISTPNPSQPSSNSFDYHDLAIKFSVFSPSFMFTLKPNIANNQNNNNNNQNYNYKKNRLSSPSSPKSSTSPPLSPQPSSSPLATTNCLNLLVTSNPLSPLQSSNNNNHLYHIQYGNTTKTATSSTTTTSSSILAVTHERHERHIKLLAKSLQTLANMTECKEPFMMPLSEFLNLNKPSVIKFIEEISSVNNDFKNKNNIFNNNNNNKHKDLEDEDEAIRVKFEQASCKQLAILHRILNSFLPQIKLQSESIGKMREKEENDNDDDDKEHNEDCLKSGRQREISFAQSMQRLAFILDEINVKMTQ